MTNSDIERIKKLYLDKNLNESELINHEGLFESNMDESPDSIEELELRRKAISQQLYSFAHFVETHDFNEEELDELENIADSLTSIMDEQSKSNKNHKVLSLSRTVALYFKFPKTWDHS